MTLPNDGFQSLFIPRQMVHRDDYLTDEQLREILAMYANYLSNRIPPECLHPEFQWRMRVSQDIRLIQRNITWLYHWTLVFAASDACDLALDTESFFRGTDHIRRDPSVHDDIDFDTYIFTVARELTGNLLYGQEEDRADLDMDRDMHDIRRQLRKLKRLTEARRQMFMSSTRAVCPDD